MDMNGSKGMFRICIDVYPHSCSELDHPHESNELRFLCRGPNQQWACFNDSIQSHYCISSKMCAVPDKTDAICEILNIQMTDRLISQVWSTGNTSPIPSRQSCSRGPESTSNRVAGFRVLTTSNRIHRFLHNMI
jgi:hypothetical protein